MVSNMDNPSELSKKDVLRYRPWVDFVSTTEYHDSLIKESLAKYLKTDVDKLSPKLVDSVLKYKAVNLTTYLGE